MVNAVENALSVERKALQAAGEVPDWYTTGGWQLFKNKYAYHGESVKSRFKTIADSLAADAPTVYPSWWNVDQFTAGKTWGDVFFEVLWNGWVVPPTPLYSNGGLPERGHTVSCSQTYMGNNLFDRYNLMTELAVLTKHAAGCSVDLSEWPCEGQALPRGGRSEGIMPIVRDILTTMNEVAQTNRRGSTAYSVNARHGDYYKVLDELYHNPESNNVGFLYDDKEIADIWLNKNPDAIKRFAKLMEVKKARGKGYITKIDHMNRKLAEPFKKLGMSVKASNLCVAPETKILTDQGYQAIHLLDGKMVKVWNGESWSLAAFAKTGEEQKLLKVEFSNGMSFYCTPYHRFEVLSDGHLSKRVVVKTAQELLTGDYLPRLQLPVVEGSVELDMAYVNGFFSADGCESGGRQMIQVYGEKRKLKPYLSGYYSWYDQDSRSIARYKGLKQKFFVPDARYSVKSRLDWLAGVLDGDGCVVRNGLTDSVQLTSVDEEFLKEILLMLQTLSVSSKIKPRQDAGYQSMPDGNGGYKDYYCQKAYRLLVPNSQLQQLLSLGLSCKRLVFRDSGQLKDASRFVTVTAVIDDGRYDDTYCFNEPVKHRGFFNGINSLNCQEIVLPVDADHTYSCVLLNYNLHKLDEWPAHLVFIGQVMSDCNITQYLRALDNVSENDKKVLQKIKRFTEKFRALGSGVMGLGSWFQKKRIVWGSLDSFYENNRIFKHINKQSLEASQWLAEVLGEPSGCEGLGIRNATRLSSPPTKSSAELCYGVSEGINPDAALVFTKMSSGGEVFRIVPELLKIMKDRDVYSDEVLQSISNQKGSVQHVDWLDETEKKVFRTAFEIDQHAIIRLASQRQAEIDQGQSLNLYLAGNATPEYTLSVHKEAMLDDQVLSLYYNYSTRGGDFKQPEPCEVCT